MGGRCSVPWRGVTMQLKLFLELPSFETNCGPNFSNRATPIWHDDDGKVEDTDAMAMKRMMPDDCL